MTKQTEGSLRSILDIDGEIDKCLIDRAIAIMKGNPHRESDLCRVVSFQEACHTLGVDRQTIQGYIRKGYLSRVFGIGGRAIGINSNSLDAFRTPRIVHKGRRALQPEV